LRNGNKVKRSERVKAIACLKSRMRSSIGKGSTVSKLVMRELEVPIPQTLMHPYAVVK